MVVGITGKPSELISVICPRCGGPKAKRVGSTDYRILYILSCLTCGNSLEVFKEDTANKIKFELLSLAHFKRGLRKYRNNKELQTFNGSPKEVAQKNLIGAHNCISLLIQNNIEIPEGSMILKILEKVFDTLEEVSIDEFIAISAKIEMISHGKS